MAKNSLIELFCFDKEVGRIGFDEDRSASFFQYRAEFLKEGNYQNLFPLIFKRITQVQVFDIPDSIINSIRKNILILHLP